MKRFIKSIFLFGLIFIGIYCIGVFIHGTFMPKANPFKSSYGHLNARLQEVKNFKNVDILFGGASRSYRGFDTRIFQEHGYYTFNLGSSSQTPLQTNLLLKRYSEALGPKLVILEVNPGIFSSDGVESALDVINNDKVDVELIKMVLTINHFKTYRNLIYALERDLFKINLNYHQPIKQGEDTYISGGYVERERERKLFNASGNIQKIKWEPNKKQLAAFDEIISSLKEQNIDYILVSAPSAYVDYNSYINRSDFTALMEIYGEYYDFNKIVDMDDSLHFYDASHLNQNGVDIFDEKLIGIISARYDK
jgi:hypothetical protein